MPDTGIARHVIKGRSPAVATRLSSIPPDRICISAVTRAELLYGLKRLPPEHRLHIVVQQFLKIVRTLPWDSDAAEYYADIRHQLVARGQPIGEMDMMIAAHSLAVGAILVSNNLRHFKRIKAPLRLETWTAK